MSFANVGDVALQGSLSLAQLMQQALTRQKELYYNSMEAARQRIFQKMMIQKQIEAQKKAQQQQMVAGFGQTLMGTGGNLLGATMLSNSMQAPTQMPGMGSMLGSPATQAFLNRSVAPTPYNAFAAMQGYRG